MLRKNFLPQSVYDLFDLCVNSDNKYNLRDSDFQLSHARKLQNMRNILRFLGHLRWSKLSKEELAAKETIANGRT